MKKRRKNEWKQNDGAGERGEWMFLITHAMPPDSYFNMHMKTKLDEKEEGREC